MAGLVYMFLMTIAVGGMLHGFIKSVSTPK